MRENRFCAFLGGAIMLATVAGCAKQPDKIQAVYVPPMQYRHMTCDEMGAELSRVGRQVQAVTRHQKDEADGDAAAMGVGLVLFWPALFFLIGEDKEYELSRLKGEVDALEAAAATAKCDELLVRMAEAREQAQRQYAEEAANEAAEPELYEKNKSPGAK